MTSFLKRVDTFLNISFRKLGRTVAERTGYFIVIPIMLTFFFATGVQRVKYEANPEYLFSPANGRAKSERQLLLEHFPTNFSSFDPSRTIGTGRFVRFIISARDGGTIMRQNIWDDIVKVDQWMMNMSVMQDEVLYKYKNLCAFWNGKCYENKILELYDLLPELLNGSLQMNYPVLLNPHNFQVYILPVYLGGVDVDEETGVAASVKAITIYYWLRSGTVKEDERAQMWERKLVKKFNNEDFKYISAVRFTSQTLEDELEVNTASVVPFFGVTVAVIIIFSMASLLMADWVRSKPTLGLLGIISAVFGCISAFGLLMYAGVPFIGINLAAPFLMLGIGIDDMFVMLASWRRTYIQDPVPKRLGEAYCDAAVSITITSLTDMVSFFIGIMTPFPSVQIFCIYTGTAVFMTYLWQITFFGACMAIAGKAEAQQKHSFLCHSVKPKSVAEKENGCCYNFWCAGGVSKDDPWNYRDNKPHAVMVFFRECVGNLLNKTIIKALVMLLFMVYLGGAIYGCLMVREGLERRRLSRFDSYSVDFYDMEDNYFREYPYRIQVVITGDLQYGNPETRQQLLELHEKFENLSCIAGSLYTESWIRGWYEFLDNNAAFIAIDTTNETDFIRHLQDIYLSGEDNVYKLDAKFNKNNTRITGARFVIQSYKVLNSNSDKSMMNDLRKVADESPLQVNVHHPLFIFFDQYVLVRKVSIQAICLAAVVMMIVSLIFIPNPWCSLWVAFAIVSIEVGVVGYMTFWGVNLDSISMINLIMCIGFSVDFSAHISYSYLTADVDTPEERVRECLFTLGLPILQGAISTILGVSALVAAPSYLFVTFFKTVFLVVLFGALHGILLLPVLLSILGPGSRKKGQSSLSSLSSPEAGNLSIKPVPLSLDRPFMKTFANIDDAEEENDSDKDVGIGTSGESSSDSSLSKATSTTAVVLVAKMKNKSHQSSLPALEAYCNRAFVTDEDDEIIYRSRKENGKKAKVTHKQRYSGRSKNYSPNDIEPDRKTVARSTTTSS